MTGTDIKNARLQAGWTQMAAARKLAVTQAYLSMVESGSRAVSDTLSRKSLRVFDLPPTLVPFDLNARSASGHKNQLQADLGTLGYLGFAYLKQKRKLNPAQVLFTALDQSDLDARTIEGLPWLAFAYPDMGWGWLTNRAKLNDRQNRLGFIVTLAGELAHKHASYRTKPLATVRSGLDQSRLAREDTLCHDSMTNAERTWLREHRSQEAAYWNLLTDLRADQLVHVTI
jgi:transcriptional regulator with XRE-family HTH domain